VELPGEKGRRQKAEGKRKWELRHPFNLPFALHGPSFSMVGEDGKTLKPQAAGRFGPAAFFIPWNPTAA
jgi:hypothetical protein